MRNLHAQVATGDHDRVGEADNVIDMFKRCRLFDLGHDPGAITDQPAGLDDVSGLLDERKRHPVDPQFQAEGEIGPVLRGQWRQIQDSTGDIDALAVRDHAANDDFCIDEICPQPGHANANPAVVDQQIIVWRDRLENLGMGKRNRHLVAIGTGQDKTYLLSGGDG